MKCGIMTVYNSENCGSFLQAYAMAQALKKMHCEPVFVKQNFKDHSASKTNYAKILTKTALKGNFKGVFRLVRRRVAFRSACEYLCIVDEVDSLPCVILGSDVIWDLTVPFFKNHYESFWGFRFDKSKIIPYAPSIGFAKTEHFENAGYIRSAFKNMTAVSVRDQISKNLLVPYCDKPIQVVCDPTYLIEREDYDAIAKPTALEKFLFLYYYGNMSTEDQKAIQALAAQEGLKTVTFGNCNSWCDIQLAYDPLLFLSIYDKADYIITNTFHGTVFATIYEKRFAVIKNDKPKVLDVLEMCAMSDKMTQTAEDIATILHSDFNYALTRQNILRERENGLRYLKNALEGSETNE